MKRTGNLWQNIYTTKNIMLAYRKARKGKTLKKPVREFSQNIRANLRKIQQELREETWEPSPYRHFTVYEPKERQIAAACFADRIVHHALMNVIEPILEKFQVHHSYACRKGKGTHAAVYQAYQNQRRYPFFLKMDIRKYFPNISHDLLERFLQRQLKDKKVLQMFHKIIAHGGVHGIGLPIGNLTSQHLANFYLSHLDHFVLQKLAPQAYVRYMDDFVLWAPSREKLMEHKIQITQFVKQQLALQLKPQATALQASRVGLQFLGFRILPQQIRLSQKAIYKYRQHAKLWKSNDFEKSIDSVQGWYSVAHMFHWRLAMKSA